MALFPALLALLSAALFGAATPAGKLLLRDFPPLQLAGLLYLGAALAVAPLALRRGPARRLWPRSRAQRLRLLGAVALGGGVAPVLMLAGLREAHAASVSLWLNLELAATAALGALFFRDPLGPRGWLGILLVLAASAILSAGEGAAGVRSGLLVGGACLAWALDNHWTALLDGLPVAASTFWKGAVAGVLNLALGLATSPAAAGPGLVLAALAVGGLCYGASIALHVTAAHGLGATRAQIVFASAPAFGVALSVLGLGEPLLGAQVAAAVLLGGSLVLVLGDRHLHAHRHDRLAHTHLHTHDDGHHDHEHPGSVPAGRHAHWHVHEPRAHAHPHWPDLHHRHPH
jgi:uncharacterized membrane protein